MDWAEALTAANDADHAVRRLQLRRARGDPRRRARASRAGARRSSARCLYAPEMHDPDLIIRTSGEQRLSNYLLWQSAYSELVFRDELWPDFSREAFEQSLAEYAARAAAASGAAEQRAVAARRRRRRRARRRAARWPARLGPRRARPRRDPGDRVRRCSSSIAGRPRLRARAVRARLRLPARALRDVRRARIPCAWPASWRSPGCCWPRTTATSSRSCWSLVARAAAALRARAAASRARHRRASR